MPFQVVISPFNAPRGLRRLRDKEANRNEAATTHRSALLASTDSAFAQFEGIVVLG